MNFITIENYYSNKMNKSDLIIYGIISFIILCIVGLGISVITIYQESQDLTDGSQVCQQFPANLTSYTLEKQIFSRWHWRYNILEFTGYAELKCPTTKFDSVIYINGQFTGYIDGKILSVVSRSEIKDCHGNLLYVVETGN